MSVRDRDGDVNLNSRRCSELGATTAVYSMYPLPAAGIIHVNQIAVRAFARNDRNPAARRNVASLCNIFSLRSS
jgi:hypothetical protein